MARVLEIFCAIGSAVSLVAIAWQLIASGKVTASFPIFLQWCTIFAIFADTWTKNGSSYKCNPSTD